MKENPKIGGAIDVSLDTLCCNQVNINRDGHKLTHLMHSKAEIKTCESQIMKGAYDTPIFMRVNKNEPSLETNLRLGAQGELVGLEDNILCLSSRS